ncbi:TPA: APC family permease, partial [Mannheimia haemolytica]|nr:APC family permease [Mannheimia haemolytica]
IISLNISAIPLLIKYLLPSSFRFAFLYTFSGWDVYVSDIFICTLILVLFLFLNYKGIKKGVKFQTFFAILMVCSILILFLGSIINNDSRKEINYISEFNSIKNYLWMSIIAVVPWAFVGFETTPQISRDIKNSKQKSVLIISISIFFGLLFYLMINYITALNMDLNYNDITQSAWATGDGIKNKLGITGMSILSIAMILSILSGINGFILASIKLLESMSKFEIVPEYLLENNRFSNKKSIIFIFYLCVFIPWLGRNILLDIASIASIGISIGFLYVTISDIRSQYELYGKVSKKLSYIAVIISITFIALLLVPGSPAALSSRSIFLLSIFLVLSVGIFSIKKIIRN